MVEIVAEIGLNHNGDLAIAKKLIDVAASAGCHYVKFQKRTPELCVPDNQKNIMRETPWGLMTYLEYRYKVEFGFDEYAEINQYCKSKGVDWFASIWDLESLGFMDQFNPVFIKIPSALITDKDLLIECAKSRFKIIMSTGMSDFRMIQNAVSLFDSEKLYCLMHTTSTYPCKTEELNLNCIKSLKRQYPWLTIGYSNHHPGVIYMPVAVALGAEMIEFHITLDRSMWGSDHAASIEPEGVFKLVKYIQGVEKAMGDGIKRIYDSELPIIKKLRKET